MKNVWLVLLSVALCLAAGARTNEPRYGAVGIVHTEPFNANCPGTLITPFAVLTSAHCFAPLGQHCVGTEKYVSSNSFFIVSPSGDFSSPAKVTHYPIRNILIAPGAFHPALADCPNSAVNSCAQDIKNPGQLGIDSRSFGRESATDVALVMLDRPVPSAREGGVDPIPALTHSFPTPQSPATALVVSSQAQDNTQGPRVSWQASFFAGPDWNRTTSLMPANPGGQPRCQTNDLTCFCSLDCRSTGQECPANVRQLSMTGIRVTPDNSQGGDSGSPLIVNFDDAHRIAGLSGGPYVIGTLNDSNPAFHATVFSNTFGALGPWIEVATRRSQQHVFYRLDDGTIQHIFWDQPTDHILADNWSARAGITQKAAGNPATMVTPKQQHIFYRLDDGTIQHILWDATTNRIFADNWSLRANIPHTAVGDPATMVTADQQHIFFRLGDGTIQHILWDAATNRIFADNWSSRANIRGKAVGDPATMVTPNQQHIFYRLDDGTIQHIFWDAATNRIFADNWSSRANIRGKAVGDPATMVTPKQQHIFYRLDDGTIQHIFWDEAANKIFADNWSLRANTPHTAVGDPATMVTANQQHIFFRLGDGTIQHVFWDAATNRILADNWSSRANIPRKAAGDPATMVTLNQQHIFYRLDDGTIQHVFWDLPMNKIFADNWSLRANIPRKAAGEPATMVTSGK